MLWNPGRGTGPLIINHRFHPSSVLLRSHCIVVFRLCCDEPVDLSGEATVRRRTSQMVINEAEAKLGNGGIFLTRQFMKKIYTLGVALSNSGKEGFI